MTDEQVYIVRRRNGDVKIGTTTNLAPRLASIRHQHGPIMLLWTEPGGRERESRLHAVFARERVRSGRGEWFHWSDNLASYVGEDEAMAKVCRAFPTAEVT